MRHFAFLLTALICSLSFAAPPRYQLTPGKILRYSQHLENTMPDSSTNNIDGTIDITVLRDVGDGWFRILFVKTTSYSSSGGGTSNPSATRVWFDMKPDGELRLAPGAGPAPNIQNVLPRLPNDDDAFAKGWSDTYAPSNVTTNYVRGDSDQVFTGTETGAYHTVNKRVDKWTYTFDAGKGFVSEVEATSTHERGGNQNGKGTLKLEAEDSLGDQLKTYADEVDALAELETKGREVVRSVLTGALEPDAGIEKVDALYQASATATTVEDLKEQNRRVTSSLRAMIIRYKAEVIPHKDQPAAEFTLKDLDGQEHSLADYHGKVLVVDFWSADSAASLFQMQQINKLAEDFADKPVAFVAMSNDANTEDAKLVVDTCQIKYTVLQASGSMESFGVKYPPATLVIDQEGKVRNIFLNANSTRGEDIKALIETLLKEKQ